MDLLWWLTRLRSEPLTAVMSAVTYLGDEIGFIIISLFIFWCVDKYWGYYIFSVGLFGTVINQCLKITFRISRPWVIDPEFPAVENAVPAATGYSFPSGHTQNAIGTMGGVARGSKNKIIKTVFIILPILVAFSRMYLGVHTLKDVCVSAVLATALVFALYPLINKAKMSRNGMHILFACALAFSIAGIVYTKISGAFSGSAEDEEFLINYSETMKNLYTMLGCAAGLWCAYIIDTKWGHFETRAPWQGQALKAAIGFPALLTLQIALKALFGSNVLLTAARYFIIVIFAAGVYPLIFKHLPWIRKTNILKNPESSGAITEKQ